MDENIMMEQCEMEEIIAKKNHVDLKKYRILVLAFVTVAFILSIVRIFVIQNSVESPGFISGNTNYKLDSTNLTSGFVLVYSFLGVAACIIGIICKRTPLAPMKRSNLYVFVSSLAGFCMVGCAGFFMYRRTLREVETTNLEYFVIILMLFTGVYFALDAIGMASPKMKPWFATIVAVYGVARVFSEFMVLHEFQYFSSNEYHLVSLVATMLFLCSDARLQIYGKVGMTHTAFGLFAVLALWVYTVPEMYISLFSPLFAPYYVDSVFIFCIVDVVFGFYIVAKLLSVRTKDGKKECEV